MKKKLIFSLFFVLFSFYFYSENQNSTQVIESGHWLYDDLYIVFMESQLSAFIDNQPMSVNEIKFHLKNIDYDTLSSAAQKKYDKIINFLNKESDFVKDEGFRFYGNLIITPEIYYKSNENIPWSFNYNVKDFAIKFPIILGFGDLFTIESDFFVGKNQVAAAEPDNWNNIPLSGSDMEFLMPHFTYGSTGKTFDKWGYNFHIGKSGKQINKTEQGSIIYNNTYETDCYMQLNLFSNIVKYTMDVAEVDNSKFLYLHQVNIHPFKKIKVSVIEGSQLNSSFELRYLNPLMIMHSFASWYQYEDQMTPIEYDYYGEGHFCAYLGINLEYMPFRNLRIYGLFAQNEILDLGGSRSDQALSMPDSIGGQIGAELNIPLKNDDYFINNLEVVYTSPYLYIKQSPEWTLYRNRWDVQSGGDVISWIGSPYGPDCFAVSIGSKYKNKSNWEVGFNYLFKIHGENNAQSLFSQKTVIKDENGTEQQIYSYYPWTKYKLGKTQEEKKSAKEQARNMWMSGIPEYTNKISIYGDYQINDHFDIYGKFIYSFVINSNNIKEKNENGAEVSFALQYKLF